MKGGRQMIPFSAALRATTQLRGGDPIAVTLTLADSPRTVEIPPDLEAAFAAACPREFFAGLSNSLQRYHVDNINAAKAADTRQRRVEKAIALFLRQAAIHPPAAVRTTASLPGVRGVTGWQTAPPGEPPDVLP